MREFFILIGSLLLLFVPGGFAWSAWMGAENVVAYAWAAGICLFFGGLALLTQELGFRMGNSFAGSLGSIIARTFGPLAVGLFVDRWAANLVEHRFFLAFVGCFLLTLTAETILSVRLVNRWESSCSQSKELSEGQLPDKMEIPTD